MKSVLKATPSRSRRTGSLLLDSSVFTGSVFTVIVRSCFQWNTIVGRFFIKQESCPVPVEIFKLARVDRVEEERDSDSGQSDCQRYQEEQNLHGYILFPRRRLLMTTASEEIGIAMAAAKGETQPMAAAGTASAL